MKTPKRIRAADSTCTPARDSSSLFFLASSKAQNAARFLRFLTSLKNFCTGCCVHLSGGDNLSHSFFFIICRNQFIRAQRSRVWSRPCWQLHACPKKDTVCRDFWRRGANPVSKSFRSFQKAAETFSSQPVTMILVEPGYARRMNRWAISSKNNVPCSETLPFFAAESKCMARQDRTERGPSEFPRHWCIRLKESYLI